MQLSLLLVYALSVFMLIITPGPVVALVVNTSLVAGPRRALLTALGTNWASLVLVMVAALILSGTLAVSTTLLNWISLAGCVFIGHIALHGLMHSSTAAPAQAAPAKTRGSGLITGFLVGISNPKDILFFVSFFPQFINVTSSFKGSIALLALVWIVIDLSILTAYIFLMRHAFALKYQRKIARASSFTLLLVAVGGAIYSGWILFN